MDHCDLPFVLLVISYQKKLRKYYIKNQDINHKFSNFEAPTLIITTLLDGIMLEYPNGCKDNASIRKKQEFEKEISLSSAIQLSSLYENSSLYIETAEKIGGQYHLYGRSTAQYGICPYCGTVSHRVHSRYLRVITDLPILGAGVIIHFHARKFFCEGACCHHKTFAEQPGNEIFRYRRRTRRCEVLVTQQGSSCSSNLAKKLLSAMNQTEQTAKSQHITIDMLGNVVLYDQFFFMQ